MDPRGEARRRQRFEGHRLPCPVLSTKRCGAVAGGPLPLPDASLSQPARPRHLQAGNDPENSPSSYPLVPGGEGALAGSVCTQGRWPTCWPATRPRSLLTQRQMALQLGLSSSQTGPKRTQSPAGPSGRAPSLSDPNNQGFSMVSSGMLGAHTEEAEVAARPLPPVPHAREALSRPPTLSFSLRTVRRRGI